MLSLPSLPQALDNLVRGETVQDSFQVVFDSYHNRVQRFLVRKGLSESEAGEAAQEVFLLVYRHLGQLRDPDRFEPWLFTIARNRVAQHFEYTQAAKRSSDLVTTLDSPDQPGDGMERIPDRRAGPLETLLDREKQSLLREALEDLPAQARRCVVARIGDQYSVQEIARSMGISVNTVKVHLHRAKLMLTERLRGRLGEVRLDE
jgi:RNA polymerase sigma-70 factor, ECF subfamily